MRYKATRIILTAFFACILTAGFAGAAAAERRLELPLELKCGAWALADESGNVIAGSNENQPLDMAGCSRLMTALIAAEEYEAGRVAADTKLTVSREAAKTGGTSAFLAANGEYAFETLYSSMLLAGANDAACAIAEHISGSEAAFVERMNARMAKLGESSQTVFVNCSGHAAEGQVMTAAQAAVLGATAASHASILENAKRYTGVLTHESGRTTDLVNPNRLVKTYSGCDGLATGSNKTSGYSGIYTAMREQRRFIVCVAGAENDAARQKDAKSILDCAFSSLETVTAIEKGKGVARDIPVEKGRQKTVHGIAGDSLTLTLRRGQEVKKELKLYADSLEAPVAENQKLGEVNVYVDGVQAGSVSVLPLEPVKKSSWIAYVGELAQAYACIEETLPDD